MIARGDLRLALLVRWWRLVDWWEKRPSWVLFALYLALVLLACVLVTGCATRTVYVDRPGPVQIVERRVYIGVPPELTTVLPIATGPLAQCPLVARDRRAQLEVANQHLEAISKLQGQPAP